MRAVLMLGALVVIGSVIFMIAPSVSVQNSGTATLVAVNGSGARGTATLTPLQSGQATIITVQLQQLEAQTTYALSITQGSCYGTLLTALQPATTDVSGVGTSSTTVSAPVQASWFIVLYNGNSTRSAVLACGQVVLGATVTGTDQPIITTPIINLTPTTAPPGPPGATPTIPGQFPNTGGGPPQQP